MKKLFHKLHVAWRNWRVRRRYKAGKLSPYAAKPPMTAHEQGWASEQELTELRKLLEDGPPHVWVCSPPRGDSDPTHPTAQKVE